MLRLSLSIVCGLGFVASAQGGDPDRASVQKFSRKESTVLAQFDVPRGGDLLLIPVEIAGKSVNFVLDTGSALSAIDETLAKEIGPLKMSSKMYPKEFPKIYQIPVATLAGSSLSFSGDVAVINLTMLRAASGYNVQGILGIEFLQKFVVQIDCDRGKVWFLDSNPEVPGGLKIARDKFLRPVLPVQLSASKVTPMLLDTGMIVPGVGELNADTFSELVDKRQLLLMSTHGRVATVSGEHSGRKGRLVNLCVGDFKHPSIGIREGTLNALGLDYLSRYIFTIDFPNNLLHLQEGRRFEEATAFDMSGLVILREDGKTTVVKAHEGSPAHALGIRNGDQLLKLNGKDCEKYSLMEIRRILARKGQNVSLDVDNGFAVTAYRLILVDWQNSLAQSD